MIAMTSTFTIEQFTVQQRPIFDNPAWALYRVFINGQLVGKQLSVPTISDCKWLLAHPDGAYSSSRPLVRRGYSTARAPSQRHGNATQHNRRPKPKKQLEPA